jgi:hypothetical protein
MPTLFVILALLQAPNAPAKPVDVPDIAFLLAQEEFVARSEGVRHRVKLGHGRPFRLVRMLASPSWEVRDEAHGILRTMGPESIPAILAGSLHPDAEIRARCVHLLDRYWCSHCRNRGACPWFRAGFIRYRKDVWVRSPPDCSLCHHEYTTGGDAWRCDVCAREVPFNDAEKLEVLSN